MCSSARATETSWRLLPIALTYSVKRAVSKFCDCGKTRCSSMFRTQCSRSQPETSWVVRYSLALAEEQMPGGKPVVPAEKNEIRARNQHVGQSRLSLESREKRPDTLAVRDQHPARIIGLPHSGKFLTPDRTGQRERESNCGTDRSLLRLPFLPGGLLSNFLHK